MEQQIQQLHDKIDELTAIVEENQQMIKSMYRRAQIASYFVAIKWIVIIGLTVGSLYFIQPYLETLMKIYGSFGSSNPAQMMGQNSGGGSILDLIKGL
jgi:hypothetical protein